jgi:hypothetical protein
LQLLLLPNGDSPDPRCCAYLIAIFLFIGKMHVQYNPLRFVLRLFIMSIRHSLIIYPSSHTVYCPVNLSLLKMSTLATIRLLVKEIGVLSNSLSDAVLKGSKNDKIWSVMNTEECNIPHETFNQQFDVLFAEDCRDSDGRLHHVC